MTRTAIRRLTVAAVVLAVSACGDGGPASTTEAVAETTGAPETSAAPQTTQPTETSAPPESTVPETTTPMEVEQIDVQMAFRWPLSQQYSTFLVGVPAGIYAEYGLEPNFIEGTGSATTAQLIATQQADFAGAVSSNATLEVVNGGGDIKMIGETLPSVTIAILSGGETCIEEPADIPGNRIALPPGTTQSQMFPALLAANDISEDDFELVTANADTLVPGFLSGQFDGYVSYIVSNVPLLRGEGVEPCVLLFSEHGVDLSPGETIITHQGMIDSNPDLVERFVSAVEDSHRYAVENPEEACEAGVAMFPDQMATEVCSQAVELTVDQIGGALTDEPFVCIDPEALNNTIDLLVEYAEFTDPLSFDDYATNEFVADGCPG